MVIVRDCESERGRERGIDGDKEEGKEKEKHSGNGGR